MAQSTFDPASLTAPPSYERLPFRRLLKWGLIFSTILGFILIIPRGFSTDGVTVEALAINFGSSYTISLCASLTIWTLLGWALPLAERRRWPPIRAWALAAFCGGMFINTLYAILFPLFFGEAGQRLAFFLFWMPIGAVLSFVTTALFWSIERVQRELARGRAALVKNAALAQELTLARTIQERLLPAEAPAVTGLEIAGVCIPAREVGGDLLNYQLVSGDRLSISIGDVTGKGVGAAMLMGVTLGALQAEIHDHEQPAYVLQEIDRWLRTTTSEQVFVALSAALIDQQRRVLTLANAGQLQPILLRDGRVRFLETPGSFPLGIGLPSTFEQRDFGLEAGDLLVFYTDGVVEARNPTGELWGFERLVALLEAVGAQAPAGLLQTVIAALEAHSAGAEHHDDITLIVVRIA